MSSGAFILTSSSKSANVSSAWHPSTAMVASTALSELSLIWPENMDSSKSETSVKLFLSDAVPLLHLLYRKAFLGLRVLSRLLRATGALYGPALCTFHADSTDIVSQAHGSLVRKASKPSHIVAVSS